MQMNKKMSIFVILTGLLFAGCSGDGTTGYTTQSQFPSDVKTVYIPVWTRGKDVYRRDIEMRLTEALVKRLQQNTPYRIAKKGEADTELSGEIIRIDQEVLHYNPDTGKAREIGMLFTVNFTWKDLRSGKILVSREKFQVSTTYIPDEEFNEDFFVGSEDLVNKLARLIVEQLESDW